MKIVISGASGSVGSEVVPLLVRAGHILLLISRNPEKLKAQFPGLNIASAESWEQEAIGYDTFLHLAVMNNDVGGSLDDFMQANTAVTSWYAEGAKRVAISRFVYPSTVQALLPGNDSPYAQSKVAGAQAAEDHLSNSVDVVYLGLLHGKHYAGKLSFLNRFPRPFAAVLFSLFSALKPTTSVQLLADYLGRSRPPRPRHSLILTDKKATNHTYRLWQKFLSGAFVILVFLMSPLLLVIWGVILVEDGRPGFFFQERIGRSRTLFRCVKFRTMRNGTEPKGTHLVRSDAVTRTGSLLRRLKIDELPQAWNVVRGEMVLIGPRPCLPHQREVIAARESRDVVDYRPGLSGWAQVNGVDMSEPEQIARYDSEYLGLQSVWLDVLIMKRTIFGVRSTRK